MMKKEEKAVDMKSFVTGSLTAPEVNNAALDPKELERLNQ
jgi:hypothetical protein